MPQLGSFFLGGFECSTHRLLDGKRLDMVTATRHAEFADKDYQRLHEQGFTAVREGVGWPVCERRDRYDFTPLVSRVRAAERYGVRVIWDLMHFGWPDDVNVFSPHFPAHFARYAAAFARWLGDECSQVPIIAPINEMSYLAWAGGDVACLNPFELARGVELKVQLVRATMAAMDAIRAVAPRARFLQPEPVINIVADPAHPKTWRRVESDNLLQYQAWDMLSGRVWPELGGGPRYLDIIGVNFYPDNQFMLDGATVRRDAPSYKPFSRLLLDVWQRYGRPLLIAETGSEGEERANWLDYVASESEQAMRQGCELHGITLYPVLDHPGWVDGRHCENGLWSYANDAGDRAIHTPLAQVVQKWGPRLTAARSICSMQQREVRVPDQAPVERQLDCTI